MTVHEDDVFALQDEFVVSIKRPVVQDLACRARHEARLAGKLLEIGGRPFIPFGEIREETPVTSLQPLKHDILHRVLIGCDEDLGLRGSLFFGEDIGKDTRG